ncbi:Hypothetical protein, putative, partial [Bodo saltans]
TRNHRMDQLQTQLRRLEDINALAHTGDVVLARELFRTVAEGPRGKQQAWSTSSGSRRKSNIDGHHTGSSNRQLSTTPVPMRPARLAPLHDRGGTSTPEPMSMAMLQETHHHSAIRVTNSDDDDVVRVSEDPQHLHQHLSTLSSRPSESSSSSAKRMQPSNGTMTLSNSSSSAARSRYPESLLDRLERVHNVDPTVRRSIGDLDEAIGRAEEANRQLYREVRRRQVQFENLEPKEGYLLRQHKTIKETIELEQKDVKNEAVVLQQRISTLVAQRDGTHLHIAELKQKLGLLKHHVDAVHAAVSAERRMDHETFPSLSEQELFGGATSAELSRRIEEKRHSLKEAKQYLYKLRIKNSHSLTSAARQVEKKRRELDGLRSDAILFGPPVPPPLPPAASSSSSDNASPAESVLILTHEEKPFSTPPLENGLLSADNAPQPRKQSTPHVTKPPPTSIELLQTLSKRTTPPPTAVRLPTPPWASQLPKDRGLRLASLQSLIKTSVEAEAAARKQLWVILHDSWELLMKIERIERLVLEEREFSRVSAQRQRRESPTKPLRKKKTTTASSSSLVLPTHDVEASQVTDGTTTTTEDILTGEENHSEVIVDAPTEHPPTPHAAPSNDECTGEEGQPVPEDGASLPSPTEEASSVTLQPPQEVEQPPPETAPQDPPASEESATATIHRAGSHQNVEVVLEANRTMDITEEAEEEEEGAAHQQHSVHLEASVATSHRGEEESLSATNNTTQSGDDGSGWFELRGVAVAASAAARGDPVPVVVERVEGATDLTDEPTDEPLQDASVLGETAFVATTAQQALPATSHQQHEHHQHDDVAAAKERATVAATAPLERDEDEEEGEESEGEEEAEDSAEEQERDSDEAASESGTSANNESDGDRSSDKEEEGSRADPEAQRQSASRNSTRSAASGSQIDLATSQADREDIASSCGSNASAAGADRVEPDQDGASVNSEETGSSSIPR